MKLRALLVAVAMCAAIASESVASQQPQSVTLQASPAPSPSGRKAGADPPADPNAFYYYGGTRIMLRRSPTEFVVKFAPGPPEARQALVAGLAPSARIDNEITTEGRAFHLLNVPAAAENRDALSAAMNQLRPSEGVQFVANVFYHAETNTRMLPTDEIVVKLRAGGTKKELTSIGAALQLKVSRAMWGTKDEFVLALESPKSGDVLEKAQRLSESGSVQWAEPNFIRQYKKFAVPNDTRFGSQWHLSNTGQGGGTVGADVEATNAWDTQTGNSAITIAVVDDGLDKTHEDLAANLFTNPGEIAANGIDDDHNGYIDDVNGWDFSNDDNDPSHTIDDDHGTAVSGVAAARGNNSLGVTGACQTCKILPVKIFSPDYAGDTATANALRYAGSLADVVNNSWGGGPVSATLQSAIQTATTTGRGGKGTPLLFASGNDSSGNFTVTGTSIPAGTHRFRWTYYKDISIDDGDDTVWLSWVSFPGGTLETFESGSFPAGWTTGGNANWSVVNDAIHSDESRCFTRAAKAGTITHNQETWIEAVKTVPLGNFLSFQWVSGEEFFDGLVVEIDLNNNGSVDLATGFITGVPFTIDGVSYPAAYPESIAVGASTNFDCRSYYSQVGPQLAFVAPSNGGPLNLGIETTDRTGSDGYDLGNYTQAAGSSGFGGTSSATPLASGIAGLILSRNSSLTRAQVLSTMQNTAEKVGPLAYSGGRNDRYGYGRLNANQALSAITSCPTISVTPITVPDGLTFNLYSQTFVASGGTPAYTFSAPVGTLPPGLTLSSAGVLSGIPSTAGLFSFTLVATDANGCTGYRAINMQVNVGTPSATQLYIVTPCRVIDTRNPVGPSGGPALPHLGTRDVQLTSVCGIPGTAKAVIANITAVGPTTTGFMAFFPTGSAWPGNSTINYRAGKTRANNAILIVSGAGQATVLNNGSTQHFIVDVTGYFQ